MTTFHLNTCPPHITIFDFQENTYTDHAKLHTIRSGPLNVFDEETGKNFLPQNKQQLSPYTTLKRLVLYDRRGEGLLHSTR